MEFVKIYSTLMFVIFSSLSHGVLSVLPENESDEYPFTCEFTENCPASQKCINNICVDACNGIECNLHEMCVPDMMHGGKCECVRSSNYSRSLCAKPCVNDNDCEPRQECKSIGTNFHQCVCRPGFVSDERFPEYSCRYRCQTDVDCSKGSFCIKQMCLDFCDSTKCPHSHPICVIIGTSHACFENYASI